MDPNAQIKNNIGCKELLLRKLSYAVISSVISQVIILVVFLLIVNFNLLHPLVWLKLTFSTIASISSWLFIVPFLSITFAQSVICAKDYVLKSTYSSSRIQNFFSVISLRNILLFILHIFSGGLITWLYLSLAGGIYGSFVITCKSDHYCLNKDAFYLITCGLWTGLYFFIRIYTSEKKILFPVVQQLKLLQFKSKLVPLIKVSQRAAILPSIYFTIVYFFWGELMENYVSGIFSLHKEETNFSYIVILFSWFFSTLYIFTMNLMRFFFELFLTEPIDFPIATLNKNDLILSHALSINSIPIIQHLACFDVFLFSRISTEKRKLLFALSQPGNHPHNWNSVITNILEIIKEYTDILTMASNAILNPEPVKKVESLLTPMQSPISSPNITSKNYSFNNMRNLSLQNFDIPLNVISVTENKNNPFTLMPNSLLRKTKEQLNAFLTIVKAKFGINYLFGQLPLRNIQYCLENGQIIIWVTQGLSNLLVASLHEDNFGIVQKDVPVILSALVELKQSIEKLNRIPAFTRKMNTADDFNIKMKTAVHSALKRSLYNICKHFKPYMNDMLLKKETIQFIQPFIPEK